MVFSTFPTNYSDSSNWQHQPIITATTVGFTGNSHLFPPPPLPPQPPQQQPPPPPPPPPLSHGGGHGGSVRPGSMAERARLANIPMPETALKCPRCESTNTKFCYFNNYSLSQPRHFCKTCRRYWTRGGALRSVPVGGGCRRNKRTKATSGRNTNATSSKSQDSSTSSQTSSDHQFHRSSAAAENPIGPTSSLGSLLSSYNAGLIAGHDPVLGLGSSLPSLKLIPPNLHHDFTSSENFGLQYGAVSAPHDITAFHLGGGGGGGGGASGLLSSLEQWRFPAMQLPLLGGLDISSPSSSSGLYPFDQTGMEQQLAFGVTGSGQFMPKNTFQNPTLPSSCSSHSAMVTAAASQLASVKVEDSTDQLNLSRQLLGSDQLWNVTAAAAATTTASWSDVSNFSSSSTGNHT